MKTARRTTGVGMERLATCAGADQRWGYRPGGLARRCYAATFAVAALTALVITPAALAATFASGTFKGHTSQVGPIGNLGHRAHGTISITAGDLRNNPAHPAVLVAPFYITRCRIGPTPMGFYSGRQIPKIFMVHNSRFGARFRYADHVEDVDNGDKVIGYVSGSLTGEFRSMRRIAGRIKLTVRVFEHGRQQNTCTADFTYSARRR